MAILWVEGFEHGSTGTNGGGLFNTVTGTGLSVQSTTKRTGTYALQANTSSAQAYVVKTISTNYVTGRFYIRWETLASATQIFLNLGTTNAKIYLNSSNVFCVDINGAGIVTSSTTAVTGQWYRIDFSFNSSANPQTLDWQIDGAVQTQSSRAVAAAASTNITLGQYSTATANLYIDDCVFSDTTAEYPFGPGAVEVLLPDEDVSLANPHNYLVNASGTAISASVHAHDQLNNIPLSETTTRVAQTEIDADDNDATYVQMKFADTSQTDIHGIQVFLNYGAAGTSTCRGVCITTNEDAVENTIWGSPASKADYSDTSPYYKSVVPTAPSGGWDQAAVNAQSVTIGMSSDASPDPYWNNICMQVAYGTVDPSVTIVPSPITGTFSQVDPTVIATSGVTVSPSPITGQFSVWNNPSVIVYSTYVPDPITAQLSTVDPTVSAGGGGITVTPNPIDGQFSASGMSAQISSQIAVEPVTGQFDTVTPAYVGAIQSVTVTPAPITGIFEAVAATVKAAATVVCEVILGLFTIASNPVLTIASTYVPEAITDQFEAITPTVSITTAQGVTVTPNPITGQFSLVDPSVATTASVVVIPSHITGQFSIVDPTIATTTSTSVVPSPITGSFSICSFTTQITSQITPDPITGTFSTVDPTVSAGGSTTVVAGPITGAFSVVDPTITTASGVTITPDPITGQFSQVAPTIKGSCEVDEPSPITGQFSIVNPTVRGSAVVVPGAIAGQFSMPTPTVKGSAVVIPSPITGQFSLVDPAVLTAGNVTVTPAPITGTFTIGSFTAQVSSQVALEPIAGTFSLVDPTIDIDNPAGAPVTVTPAPITGQFSACSFTPQVSSQIAVEPVTGQFSTVDPTIAIITWTIVTPAPITGKFTLAEMMAFENDVELGVDPLTAQLSLRDPASIGQYSWSTPGSYTWTCPANINYITVKVWGGGGLGGNGSISGGGGGGAGSGGYSSRSMAVTPGVVYSLQVGGPSQESWFYSASHTIAYGGGTGGNADPDFPGTGGAGALTGMGDVAAPGIAGDTGTATNGGDGADAPYGGAGGAGGAAGYNGSPGVQPGGGGGGGGLGSTTGGDPGNGMVLIAEALLISNVNVITGYLSVVNPIVSGSCVVTPAPITGTFGLVAPNVNANTVTIYVEPITGTFSIVNPLVNGTAHITVTPTPITGRFTMPDPKVVKASLQYARMWVKAGGTWRLIS